MKTTKTRRCAICGSAHRVEANHVGGRNHVAWFTAPLCGEHHDRFHALLRQSGVDLRYTRNPLVRSIHALQATLVYAWMVVEELSHKSAGRNR